LLIVSANSFIMNLVRASFILEAMQQAAANYGSTSGSPSARGWPSPSSSVSSFAGLLTSLTSPDRSPEPEWNADDLADDVATLSYENALRAHARYKPTTPDDGDLAHGGAPQTCRACGARRSDPTASAQTEAPPVDLSLLNDPVGDSGHAHFTMNRSDKKCASITIRMSEGECEQLKRRAAEAGLTISAYLRSCAFEAEALRAEEKKTLAEMRKPATPERPKVYIKARRGWFEWFLRLIPLWPMGPRVARA
jgi:hypothetical protein